MRRFEQVALGVEERLNPSQLPTSSGAGTLVGLARPSATLHFTDF